MTSRRRQCGRSPSGAGAPAGLRGLCGRPFGVEDTGVVLLVFSVNCQLLQDVDLPGRFAILPEEV